MLLEYYFGIAPAEMRYLTSQLCYLAVALFVRGRTMFEVMAYLH